VPHHTTVFSSLSVIFPADVGKPILMHQLSSFVNIILTLPKTLPLELALQAGINHQVSTQLDVRRASDTSGYQREDLTP